MKPKPELTFDVAGHTYYLDNVKIPGVTSIIKQQLSPLWRGDSDLMQRAAAFGSAVHQATEMLDAGHLALSNIDQDILPYLDSWIKFRTEMPGEILANETPICSYKFRFGGTLDRIIDFPTGPALVDIKTSTNPDAGTGPQTAAYALAAAEYFGIKCKTRYCVQLMENGYKLHRHDAKDDLPAFLAALSCWNWRSAHNK